MATKINRSCSINGTADENGIYSGCTVLPAITETGNTPYTCTRVGGDIATPSSAITMAVTPTTINFPTTGGSTPKSTSSIPPRKASIKAQLNTIVYSAPTPITITDVIGEASYDLMIASATTSLAANMIEPSVDYITFESGPSTTAYTQWNVTLEANNTDSPRSCVVAFTQTGADGNIYTGSCTITQDAATIDVILYDSSNNVLYQGPASVLSTETVPISASNSTYYIEYSSNVTSITEETFARWSNLRSVKVKSGADNNLATIGAYAFSGCSSLSGITLSDNITSIDEGAFYKCYKLSYINDTNTLSTNSLFTAVNDLAFAYCNLSSITIPSNVTYIGDSAFRSNTKLSLITLNEGLTSIGEYAFYLCMENGTDSSYVINLPNSLTSIGQYAFASCTGATSLSIGNQLSEISLHCFDNCKSINAINIPNTVTTIDAYAFYYCQKAEVILPSNGLTSIGAYAFFNNFTDWNKYSSSGPTYGSVTCVTIPDSVTTLGEYVFGHCTYLPRAIMSKNVETIPEGAFIDCWNMETCDLQAASNTTLTIIGEMAFKNCFGLDGVVFPDTTEELHAQAFYDCRNLSSINITSNIYRIGDSYYCSTYTEVFAYCYNLATVTVDTDNTTYHSQYNCCIYTNAYGTTHPAGCICFGGNNPTIPTSGNSIHIGQYAFEGIIQLSTAKTAITITDNVYQIDKKAFYDCETLAKVSTRTPILNRIGAYAFGNCSTLQSFTYLSATNSLRYIEEGAFSNCYILDGSSSDSVKILTDGLISIGKNAFEYCHKFGNIIIPNSVTSIGYQAFYHCCNGSQISIGSGVADIGSRAFSYNSGVTSVTVSSSNGTYFLSANTIVNKSVSSIIAGFNNAKVSGVAVTSIEDYAFEGNLINDNAIGYFNNATTSIGDYAFSNCSGMYCVSAARGKLVGSGMIDKLGYYVFYNCTSIEGLTIQSNLSSVQTSAFYGCENITSINYSGLRTNIIPVYATAATTVTILTGSDNCTIDDYAFEDYKHLTSVTIPDRVTSIGNYAFYNCSSLVNISDGNGLDNIGTGVTSIGKGAFEYCYALTTFDTINVTTIGDSAFYDCTALQQLLIESSLTTINSNAFYNCTALNHIYNLASTPQSITNTTFYGVPTSGKLEVSSSAAGDFGNSTWYDYFVTDKNWTMTTIS